jgi:hypothetical protein
MELYHGQKKELEFSSFCIEMYARKNGISGADVMQKFADYGVLDFLFEQYEPLHTQGPGYILPIIDEYIAGRGQA